MPLLTISTKGKYLFHLLLHRDKKTPYELSLLIAQAKGYSMFMQFIISTCHCNEQNQIILDLTVER